VRALPAILFFLGVTGAWAASVTLAWDASPAPSGGPPIAGYKVYRGGMSRSYTNMVSVGNVTTATIGGLVQGLTYFFAVTAYDTAGLESDYSEEISFTVTGTGTLPPALKIARLDQGHVVISWPTNFAGWSLKWSTDLRHWEGFYKWPMVSGTNFVFMDETQCCPDWWFYRLEK
jgi:hypothetical protein